MKKVICFSFLGFCFDQILKYFIDLKMNLYDSVPIIKDFFSLTYVQNDGAAFSIFKGNRFFLIFIAVLSLTILYFLFLKDKKLSLTEKIIYALLLCGIMGNLMDRIFRGYVIDYFDFTFFGYHYPIFNFADICIVISAVLMMICFIKEETYDKNKGRRKTAKN